MSLSKGLMATAKKVNKLQEKHILLSEEELDKLSWEKQFKRKRK